MTDIPKSIPIKYRQRIWFWDDERNIGNSLIVTLKDGWCCGYEKGLHTIADDTVKGILGQLQDTIKCDCDDCMK